MGKSKNKKSKQPADAPAVAQSGDIDTNSQPPKKAIDGHNTQGWTDNEIKAYNELIIEREKLERQRHDLEEKCAKSQTQRALLHENVSDIDSLFKPQNSPMATFKFSGTSSCCVDLEANTDCHHEICKRAKSDGVSDTELDTIKYYSMRIHAEKNERIRNALRKQRDLELLRIKKEEDDDQAQNAKKSSRKPKPNYGDISKANVRSVRSKDMTRAAKETEKIVNKIINQLDDLRSDLQAGKISAEEAQGKLNILDSKLPAIQEKVEPKPLEGGISSMTGKDIKSITESFQSHLRDRLLNAKGNTFSQAFSIMDHFLSATKPDDLQDAISELKDVLQLTGPICDELQNSLGALEGIFDNPDKLSFTGPDGKQECNSIIELMDKLKDMLRRTGQLPDGANASLTKVFQECIDLEVEAKDQLTQTCGEGLVASADLPAALSQIKEKFVAKSPIPPLTSNKLDYDIANLLDVYDARQLLAKARSGAKQTELEAQITSLVITRTQKKSVKYIGKLERLALACRSAGDQQGSNMLKDAITNVLIKMKKFVPSTNSKASNESVIDSRSNEQANLSSAPVEDARTQTVPDATISLPTNIPPSAASAPIELVLDSMKDARRTIRSAIEQNGKHGLWDTFEAYCRKTTFGMDAAMFDKAQSYKEKTRIMIEDEGAGIKATVCYLHKLKLCPGLVAVLVAQVLLGIANSSEQQCRHHMKQLSGCIAGLPSPVSPEWSATFQHLALAMVQLFVSTYVDTLATFPNASALYFAMDTVTMVAKFILLTRASKGSLNNLKIMAGFLFACFGEETSSNAPSIQNAFTHYRYFCINDRFKCTTTSSCSKHMKVTCMPFQPGQSHVDELVRQGEAINGQMNSYPTIMQDEMGTKGLEIVDASGSTDTVAFKPVVKRRPMKTTVSYFPGHQPTHHHEPRARNKDACYAASMRRAMEMYERTAKKAQDMLLLRTDSGSKDPLRPAELIVAMNVVLDADGQDYSHPRDENRTHELDGPLVNSKFSEHFYESRSVAQTATKRTSGIQHILKQLERGKLSTEDLRLVVRSLRDRAMSGRYANPIEAINRFVNSLLKTGQLPGSFKTAIAKAQNDIQARLEDPEEFYACETRRLKYLLNLVDAQAPTAPAIFQLATRSPQAFHEYYEILSDELEETETTAIEKLDYLWADVTQLAQDMKLQEQSPSLYSFVQYAEEDWKQRPSTIIHNLSAFTEDTIHGRDNHSFSEDMAQDLAKLSETPRMIADGLARRPVVETPSLGASAIASEAAISSSISSPGSTYQYPPKLASVDGITATKSDILENASTMPTANNAAENISDGQIPNLPDSLTRDNLINDIWTNQDRVADDAFSKKVEDFQDKVDVRLAIEGQDQQADDDGAHYLLPEGEVASNTDIEAKDNDIVPTVPASFRMLDMMKHLTALQVNSKDLLQTASEASKINKDPDGILQRIAEKMAAQVKSYSEFVEQIAEWNGVALAKEGFSNN